jgi:hypothetical protein
MDIKARSVVAMEVPPAMEDLSDRTPEELFAEQAILNEAIVKIEAPDRTLKLRTGRPERGLIEAGIGMV